MMRSSASRRRLCSRSTSTASTRRPRTSATRSTTSSSRIYPPLLFNVCFACGAPEGPTRVGLYGDPRSRWFNVFLGYYQLDVLANAASSPFGYDTNGDVVKDQVLRIGKSDWNYFSNWMYGVPESAILPNNTLQGATVDVKKRGITIGNKAWTCSPSTRRAW